MTNSIGVSGLTTNTQQELIDQLSAAFRVIYGADINLNQDTPDGQLMFIFAQMILDIEDLLTQINAQFDPDQAIGTILDQRCAINGIQRQAGTFTTTNVTVITGQAVTLYGVDQVAQEIFTVADNQGNQWVLLESVNLPSPGSNILAFRSAVPGAILTVPNTITIPVSVVLGVTSVNNPTTYSTLGINEESDFDLRIRRQKSVALSSQGYLAGLLAALKNVTGITSAFVYENVTGSTDADGIPSHSIWVIISGIASPAAIAQAIYTKRNAGCGMKGNETYGVAQPDGTTFYVRWDDVETVPLFIKFTATSLDGINAPNIAAIRSGLVSSFVPGVSAKVNVNTLSTAVQAIDPNTLVTSAGFSLTSGGSYTSTLTPSAKDKQFVVSSANIIIIPIILNPTSDTVAVTNQIQFSALGGYGTYVFSIFTNNSGGSINSSSGLYTAGATPSVTDVVRVTDSLGNFTNVNVSVTA